MKKKLTKPQLELLKKFEAGERITKNIINHKTWYYDYRFDNGELVRYRVFWNLMAALYGHGNSIESVKHLYFKS